MGVVEPRRPSHETSGHRRRLLRGACPWSASASGTRYLPLSSCSRERLRSSLCGKRDGVKWHSCGASCGLRGVEGVD